MNELSYAMVKQFNFLDEVIKRHAQEVISTKDVTGIKINEFAEKTIILYNPNVTGKYISDIGFGFYTQELTRFLWKMGCPICSGKISGILGQAEDLGNNTYIYHHKAGCNQCNYEIYEKKECHYEYTEYDSYGY